MSLQDELKLLHATYCRLTGIPVRYGHYFESIWFLWRREGYSEQDLEMTINYLKTSQRNRPDLLTPNLRLHKLIGDIGFFEERRAESEKCVRVREQHAAKESVLRSAGRPTEETKDAVPVSRVLDSEAFREFVKLKGKL